jgi:hypothetical protein
MDNETSDQVERLAEARHLSIQYVPVGTHRRNKAERAIQDAKNQFLSMFWGVPDDFPSDKWPQIRKMLLLTLNLLRPHALNPNISAYEGIFKAKFDPSVYEGWIHNMLSNVHQYNLVVYCDTEGYKYIEPYLKNPRIMAIIKPYDRFSTYKYKQRWMKNHEENVLLNQRTDWRLNMLWSEKLNFVKETMDEHYFDSEGFAKPLGGAKPRSSVDFTDRRSVTSKDDLGFTAPLVPVKPSHLQGIQHLSSPNLSSAAPMGLQGWDLRSPTDDLWSETPFGGLNLEHRRCSESSNKLVVGFNA